MKNLEIYLLIHLIGLRWGVFSHGVKDNIYGQALHETGNLSSELYREANNLFGMKKNQRIDAEYHGYAVYESLSHSIIDYYRRNSLFNVHYSPQVPVFVDELKRTNYFTAPVEEYRKGVLHWSRSIPSYFVILLYCIPFFILGIPTLLLIKNN